MKISAIVKGGICLLGLVGVGNILAAPASAGQQAAARGAVTLVRASGASISVSGELTLPNNDYYGPDATTGAGLTVTPLYDSTKTSAADNETIMGLTLTPGAIVEAAGTGNAFIQSAAKALDLVVAGAATGDIGAQAALIRAGAGANGLGGLE